MQYMYMWRITKLPSTVSSLPSREEHWGHGGVLWPPYWGPWEQWCALSVDLAPCSSCPGRGLKQPHHWRQCGPLPAAGTHTVPLSVNIIDAHIILNDTCTLHPCLLAGRVCGELPFGASLPAHSAALASHKATAGTRMGEWRGSAADTPLRRSNRSSQHTHGLHHIAGVEWIWQPVGNWWSSECVAITVYSCLYVGVMLTY